MSENQNCGIRDFSQYDAMPTQELEQILRLDAQAQEGQESDTETLLYIMGVLAERKNQDGHAGKTALEAYESFKLNYMPEIEDAAEAAKPKRRPIRLLRGLSAVAVVVLVILLGTMTAKAFGIDIWETVVTWTQETFHFTGWSLSSEEPGSDIGLPYSSLQEALLDGNIDVPLVPTWIPDGFELTDIKVEETPTQYIYYSIYKNSESFIKITVRDYLNSDPQYIEQSDDLVEIYTVSGIEYYLFANNSQVQAAWTVDSYECCISGNLTIDQLKLMVDSITKG